MGGSENLVQRTQLRRAVRVEEARFGPDGIVQLVLR